MLIGVIHEWDNDRAAKTTSGEFFHFASIEMNDLFNNSKMIHFTHSVHGCTRQRYGNK